MVYDKDVVGKFVTLRSITLADAEFSYNLRKDPRFISIMGQSAASLEDQMRFIEWQRKQPGDYYFVVERKNGEKIGLIGVYDINCDTAETGRELNIGEPYETIEAEILLNDFAYKNLKLVKKHFVIYEHNQAQLQLVRKVSKNAEEKHVLRSGIKAIEFETTFEDTDKSYEKYRKMIDRL